MEFTTLLPLISAVFVLGLGLFVFSKNIRSRLHLTFFLYALALTCWMFSTFMMFLNKGNIEAVIFWDRLVYAGVVFIPAIMYYFCLALTNKPRNTYLYLAYGLSFFFLIISRTEYFVSEVFVYKWGVHTKAQFFHHLFLIYFLAYILTWFYLVYKHYNITKSPTLRYQIKYFFIAVLCLFSIGSLAYLPAYGIGIYPFSYLSGVIFSIILAYAIVRYRLMDIRVVARRGLVYLSSMFIMVLVYFLLQIILIDLVDLPEKIINLIVLILCLSLIPILEKNIFTLSNYYFFSSLYDYQETITTLSRELNYYNNLKKIINLLILTVQRTLQLRKLALILIDKDTKKFQKTTSKIIGFNPEEKESLLRNNSLINFLTKNQKPLITEELPLIAQKINSPNEKIVLENLEKDLLAKGIALSLPLSSANKLIGVILLGEKVSGDAYVQEDLDLLSSLSLQAGVAIDNARLYLEVADFNKNLRQKVNAQTMDLQLKAHILEQQTEHLKKLLAMRSEFLDIASHQLKTPISVISGTISMFKERSVQKMPPEVQDRLIDNIYQKSLKISQIIRDILQASEFDTEKFSLIKQKIAKVNLNTFLAKIIAEYKPSADEKGLKLDLKTNTQASFVDSDPDYLEQALNNLIDNAIRYTKKGTILLSLDENPEKVIIKITDTGTGIPQEDQVRIFGKFERAKNAVNMYTDGSGLGLFITKEIIEAHPGGKITFTSQEGKGTEFTITLNKTKYLNPV